MATQKVIALSVDLALVVGEVEEVVGGVVEVVVGEPEVVVVEEVVEGAEGHEEGQAQQGIDQHLLGNPLG